MTNTKCLKSIPSLVRLCLTGLLLVGGTAQADTVWHCSRTDVQVADAGDNFHLASLDAEREVMRITLRDLYEVFQGHEVRVSGLPVSACVVSGNSSSTKAAMKSIGAAPHMFEAKPGQGKSAISHLHFVPTDKDMLACMIKHYPAIGYFPKPIQHEAVGPCF